MEWTPEQIAAYHHQQQQAAWAQYHAQQQQNPAQYAQHQQQPQQYAEEAYAHQQQQYSQQYGSQYASAPTGHPSTCRCAQCVEAYRASSAAAAASGAPPPPPPEDEAPAMPPAPPPPPAAQSYVQPAPPPPHAAPANPARPLPAGPPPLPAGPPPSHATSMQAYQAMQHVQQMNMMLAAQQHQMMMGGHPHAAMPVKRQEAPTYNVADLMRRPGRLKRPERICIVLRGLPGAGKSRVARTLRDIEVANGGEAPRVLSIDDYFMQETDVMKKDEESGKMVKGTEMKYVYEEEMESIYAASALKAFKGTVDKGMYKLLVVDQPNVKTSDYAEFWSHAKKKGYEVYVFEVLAHVDLCAERNIHGRSKDEITKLADSWEGVPDYMCKLTNLESVLRADDLGEGDVDEVEMEHDDEEEAKAGGGETGGAANLHEHLRQAADAAAAAAAAGGGAVGGGSGGGSGQAKTKGKWDDDDDDDDDEVQAGAGGKAGEKKAVLKTSPGGSGAAVGGKRKSKWDDDEDDEDEDEEGDVAGKGKKKGDVGGGKKGEGLNSLLGAYSEPVKKRVRWMDSDGSGSVAKYDDGADVKKQKIIQAQNAPLSAFAQKLRDEQMRFAMEMVKMREGEATAEAHPLHRKPDVEDDDED